MHPTARSRLQALFCALMLPLCGLIVHPHVELGINDDWSYIRTAQLFAQTGHFIYNAWAMPFLGWQAIFAAAFIRIFGFSFSVTRDSVVVLAMAAAFLAHRIFVRCGAGAALSTLGVLTVFLSPICLPLVFSFMTDVPSLLVIELCLYACLRALQATSSRSTAAWLVFAAATNVIGGTNRQTGWFGVLVMLPCAFWLVRKRVRRVWLFSFLLYTLSVALVAALWIWFRQHPYTLSESVPHRLHIWDVYWLGNNLSRLALEIPALLLPLLAVFLFALLRRPWPLGAALLAIVAVDLYLRHTHPGLWLAPYMINTFTPKGLLDCTPIFGNRPVLLDRHAQLLITALADAGVAACILHLLARRPALLRSAASQGMAQTPSSRQLAVLLGPFTLAYLASLCVNGAFHNIFDRYALVLVFLATLILLRVIQDTVPSRIALVGFAPLILIAAFSVAASHDAFAIFRAQLAAIYELQAAHIPSNVIDGGFEFNAWTQIERTGRVNDAHLMSPADNAKIDAFYSTPHPCSPFNVYLFPDLHARYSLSYGPRTCGEATAFAPVVYRRWLGRQSVPIYIVSHPPSIMP